MRQSHQYITKKIKSIYIMRSSFGRLPFFCHFGINIELSLKLHQQNLRLAAAFNQNQMGIYNATSALLNQLPTATKQDSAQLCQS